MYHTNGLKERLQSYYFQLSNSTEDQFPHHLKYLDEFLEKESLLRTTLTEAIFEYKYPIEALSKKMNRWPTEEFSGKREHAAFSLQAFRFLRDQYSYADLKAHQYFGTLGCRWEDRKEAIIDMLIEPIINFLQEELVSFSNMVYLLEKYKKRTEWFTKASLGERYTSLDKSYEQLLEDDLRLFLFDQGIEYPFSTPKSASGRGDIIGEIETSDPLIVEIKIVDSNKSYGKPRIFEGFTQVVKYANDYRKDVGYLVIFNFDDVEIDFGGLDPSKYFPPKITVVNKVFYFIVINMFIGVSASKAGKTKRMEILASDLFQDAQ